MRSAARSASALEELFAAGPPLQRAGLRLLLALQRRPRGRTLLARMRPLDQAAAGVAAMGHYDAPQVATALGWDADAVIDRGRELRRAERRPG